METSAPSIIAHEKATTNSNAVSINYTSDSPFVIEEGNITEDIITKCRECCLFDSNK